jgi:prevent-host-death family protein
MITANVASAKNNLSRYLRRVKAGERIVITERNRPIAQLQPFVAESSTETDGALLSLYEAGLLAAPTGPALDVVAFLAAARPVLPSGQSLSSAVLAEREDGR